MAVETFEKIRVGTNYDMKDREIVNQPKKVAESFESIRTVAPIKQKTLAEKLEPVLTGIIQLEDIFPEPQKKVLKNLINNQDNPDQYREQIIAEMLLSNEINKPVSYVSLHFKNLTEQMFGEKLNPSDVILHLSPYKKQSVFVAGKEPNWFQKAFNNVRNKITEKTGMFAPYTGSYDYDPASGKIYKSAEKGAIGTLFFGSKPLPKKNNFARKSFAAGIKQGLSQSGTRMVKSLAGTTQIIGDITTIESLRKWGKTMAVAADQYYAENQDEAMQLAQDRGLLGTTWQFITRPELVIQGITETVPMLLEAYLGHITGTKAAAYIKRGKQLLPWTGRVMAMSSETIGQTYSDARLQGTKPIEALPQAILTGVIEGAIEEFTLNKKIEVFKNALGQQARRGLATTAANIVKATGKTYGRGFAEEASQTANQNFWNMVFTEKKPLKDNFMARLSEGVPQAAATGGLLEMAMTGMFATTGYIINFVSDKEKLAKIKGLKDITKKLNLKKEYKQEITDQLDKVQSDILAGKYKRTEPAGEITAKFAEDIKKTFNIDDKQARAAIVLLEARAEAQGINTDEWIEKNIAGIKKGSTKSEADILFQSEEFTPEEKQAKIAELQAKIDEKEGKSKEKKRALEKLDKSAKIPDMAEDKVARDNIAPQETAEAGMGEIKNLNNSSISSQTEQSRVGVANATSGKIKAEQNVSKMDFKKQEKIYEFIKNNQEQYISNKKIANKETDIAKPDEILSYIEMLKNQAVRSINASQFFSEAEKKLFEKTIIENPDDTTLIVKDLDGNFYAHTPIYVDDLEGWLNLTPDERQDYITQAEIEIESEASEIAARKQKLREEFKKESQLADVKNNITDEIIDYLEKKYSKVIDIIEVNQGFGGFGSKYIYFSDKTGGELNGTIRVADHIAPAGAGFDIKRGMHYNDPEINFIVDEKTKLNDLNITQKIDDYFQSFSPPSGEESRSTEEPQKRIKKTVNLQKKAAVQFLGDGKAVLTAFEKADFSSFVHETAHIFRRTLDNTTLKVVENWAGVNEGKWDVKAEEKFARGFEKYLYEGKAPNQNLKSAFAKFREWLRQIYTKLKGSAIDINLSDNVRRVFDRMLSLPAEIHPGEMSFEDFFDKLGKELENPNSKWVETYGLMAAETPNQMHNRLKKEWQARQKIDAKARKNEDKLTVAQKKQINQIEAEAATVTEDILNSEKQKTVGYILNANEADYFVVDDFKDKLQKAYIAGKKSGIENQKNRYKDIKQRAAARKELREYIKQLGRKIAKPAPASVDVFYREAIAVLQAGIDPSFRQTKTLENRESIRKFLEKYPNKSLPDKIINIINKKALNEYTITELEALADERDKLEKQGKTKKLLRKAAEQRQLENITDAIASNLYIKKKNKTGLKPELSPVNIDDISIEKTGTGKYLPLYKGVPVSEGEIILKEGKTVEDLKQQVKIWLENDNPNVINAAASQKPFTKTIWKNIRISTLRPSRIFDYIDGGKGSFDGIMHRTFYDAVNDATAAKITVANARVEAGTKYLEKIGITEKELAEKRSINGIDYTTEELIGIYGYNKNIKSRLAITFGNGISGRQMTEIIHHCEIEDKRLSQLADWIIKEFEQHFDRLENAFIELEDRRLSKEENYLPMRRQELEYTPDEREIIKELEQRHHLKKAYAKKGFTISRQDIEPEAQKPIRLDLWGLWLEQVERQEHYIHLGKLTRDLHRIEGSDIFKNAIKNTIGEEWAKNITDYVSRVANPNVYKTFGYWGQVSRLLRNNAAISYLAFNLLTMAKQLPSVFYYLPDSGIKHLAASMYDFSVKPTKLINKVRQLDPLTKRPALERTLEELKLHHRDKYDTIIRKIGKAGMEGIYWMDTIARTIGWNAVYEKALDDGKAQAEAVRLARNATLRTQPAANPQDLASMYATHEALNWFLMFSNQLSNIYNTMTYDIPNAISSRQYNRAMLGIMGLSIGALVMWSLSHKRLPEDKEDMLSVIEEQAINAVPLAGKSIMQAKQGFGDSGIGAIKDISNVFTGTENTIKNISAGKLPKTKDIEKIIEAATVLYGIPSVGMKRVYKAIKKADPAELIGGKK